MTNEKKYYELSKGFVNENLCNRGGVWQLNSGSWFIDLGYSNSYTRNEVINDVVENFALVVSDAGYTLILKSALEKKSLEAILQ